MEVRKCNVGGQKKCCAEICAIRCRIFLCILKIQGVGGTLVGWGSIPYLEMDRHWFGQ